MQKNNNNNFNNNYINNNNNHKPPRIPPLSVSLPSPPRPEPAPTVPIPAPEPNPKPTHSELSRSRPDANPNPNPKPDVSRSRPDANSKPEFSRSRPDPNLKPKPKPTPNELARTRPEPNHKITPNEFFARSRPEPNPKTAHSESARSRPEANPKSTPNELARTRPEQFSKPAPNELPHSPLRSESLHRSDDPDEKSFSKNTDTALVAVEKYYSPLTSPLPVTPPKEAAADDDGGHDTFHSPAAPPPHQIINFSRRDELPQQSGVVYGGGGGEGGGERKVRGVTFGGVEDVVRRSKKEEAVKRVALGFRVLEIVFCLISLSVMAADKTQGWSGDSFDRYKEYRFCLSVAVLGFVYSAFQAYDLGSFMATGKHIITHRFRCQFDFIMDQILAYLLISASSAAASRVDDWQSNWGKDEFTTKASASISMAFLAFICFAVSSLISGYNLCKRDLY